MKTILKIVGGLVVLILLGVAGAVAALVLSAPRTARPIGVQQVLAPDPGHEPVAVTLFYPTSGKPRLIWAGASFLRVAPGGEVEAGRRPLVIISHGTGGAPTGHLDTALALAEAGYVVAAPMHGGDNFQDDSKVGTGGWIVDRARQIARVNDFLLNDWKDRARLDPERVGVFGFSAGGTAALVAIGGTPDLARVGPHCAADPEFACRLMRPGLRAPSASEWVRDPRVKAAVVAAPGLGFTFEPDGLSAVRAPVQLWQGGADTIVPIDTNAGIVRRLLPDTTEFHLVDKAGHAAFLPPCGVRAVLLPRTVCADPAGFDRKAFHKEFNASVVAFFDRSLTSAKPIPG